ncbi:MAG: hypothetical protein J0L70_19425 [Leptolyngbya sp. UWPOB_LEPTO1]|uniref:hypothetical protein n=1 Tax=Leptolyngbya sp. UWPOB_LEPTO1 TaxID=2815653 RepID=UPI001AD4F1D1|nr:hypothetical protein [Leptolyngbya sp. UWPOB_LEPTO1]MBN8562710.1 hypothetical protein [Leptolyngbya sp. UWPOB_LEPTO1]
MTDLPNDSSSSSEVRHPPHLTAPLGQQFIVPLGTRRLNILDPGIFSPKSTPEEEEPFSDPWVQKSPFFAQSSTQKSTRQPSEVLQPKTYGSSHSTAPRMEFEESNFPTGESSKGEEDLNSFPTSIQGESILQRNLDVDNRPPNSSESTLQRDMKQDENLAGLSEPAIPSQNVVGFGKHGSDSPSSTIQRSVEIDAGTTNLGEPAIPPQNVVDFSDRGSDSSTSTTQNNPQLETTTVQANEMPESQEASFVQRKSEASRHESDSLGRKIQRSAEIDVNVTKNDSSATKFSELTSRSQNAAEFGASESGFSSSATQDNTQLDTPPVQANETPESQEASFIQRKVEVSRHESDSLNNTIQKNAEIDASAAKFSELTSLSQNAAEFGDRRSDSSSSTIQRSTDIGKETTQLNDSFNDSAILSQNSAEFGAPESGFSSSATQGNTQPDTTPVQANETPKPQEANFIQRTAEASRHESDSLNNTIQRSTEIDASAAKYSELTSLSQNAAEFGAPESNFSSSAVQGNTQLDATSVQAGEMPESQEANFIQRKAEVSDRTSSPLDSKFQNNRPFNDSSSRSNDSTPQHQGFNLIQKQLDSSDYLSNSSNSTIQSTPQIDERITQSIESASQSQEPSLIQKQLDSSDHLSGAPNNTIQSNERITQPIESASQSQEPSLIQKQLDSSDHLSGAPNNTIQSNSQIDERITQAIESASQPQDFNFVQKQLDSSNHLSDSSNSKIQGNESIVNPIESASQSQEPNIESASQSQEPSLIQKQLDSSNHLSDSPATSIPEPGVTAEPLRLTDNHQQFAQFTDQTTVQRSLSEQPTQLTHDTHLSESLDSTKLDRGENNLNIQQISADDSEIQRQVAGIQYENSQNSEFLKNSEFSFTEEAEIQASSEASSIQRQTDLSANFQPPQASQPAASVLRTESFDLRSQFDQGNEPLQAQYSSSELETIQNQTKSVQISELASNVQSIARKPHIDEPLAPKDDNQNIQAQSSSGIQRQPEHLEDLSSSQSMRSDSKSAPSKPIQNEAEYSLQPSTEILAIQRQADPSNIAQSEHNNQPTTSEFDASTSEPTLSKESENLSSQSPIIQRQADSSDNLNAQPMNDEIHPGSSDSRSPANHDAVAHSPQLSPDIPTIQRQASLPETIEPNFHSSLSQNPSERSINAPQFSSESSTLQRAINSEDSQSIEHELRPDSSDSRSRSEFDQGQNTFISQPSLPASEPISQQSTNDLIAQRKQTGSELPPIPEEFQETKPSRVENLGDTSNIQRSEESDQPNVSHSPSNTSNSQSTAEADFIGNSLQQRLDSTDNSQSTIELKSLSEPSAIQRQTEPLENSQLGHNFQNPSNEADINSSGSQQQPSHHIEIPFNTQAPSESLNIQRQSTPEIGSGSHSVNAQLRSEFSQNQETSQETSISRSPSEFPKIQRQLDSAQNVQSEQESQQYDSISLTARSSEIENSESISRSFDSEITSEPENLINSTTSNEASSNLLQPSSKPTIARQTISRVDHDSQVVNSPNSAIDNQLNASHSTSKTIQPKLDSSSDPATKSKPESMFESSHFSQSTATEVEFGRNQTKSNAATNSQPESNLQSASTDFTLSTPTSLPERESNGSKAPSIQTHSGSSQTVIQQNSDSAIDLAPSATHSPQLENLEPEISSSGRKFESSSSLDTESNQPARSENSSSIQRSIDSDSDAAQTYSGSSQAVIQQNSDGSIDLASSATHSPQLANAEPEISSSGSKLEPSINLGTESNQPAHSESSSRIQRSIDSDSDAAQTYSGSSQTIIQQGSESNQPAHSENSSRIQRSIDSDSDAAQTYSGSSQTIIQQNSDGSIDLASSATHSPQLANAEPISEPSEINLKSSRNPGSESNHLAHSENFSRIQRSMNSNSDMSEFDGQASESNHLAHSESSSSIQRSMNSDMLLSEFDGQVSENLSDRQISPVSSSEHTDLNRSPNSEIFSNSSQNLDPSEKASSGIAQQDFQQISEPFQQLVTPESSVESPSNSIQRKAARSSEDSITPAQNHSNHSSASTIPSELVTSSENTQPELISRSLNSSLPVIPTVLQELSVLRSLNPTPDLQPKQDAYPQHTSKSSQTIDSSWSSLDDLVQSIAEKPKPIERSLPRIQRTAEISQPQPTIQRKETDYIELSTSESETEVIDYLDYLAQEVYLLLRQRLEIERERRGSNYSSRL